MEKIRVNGGAVPFAAPTAEKLAIVGGDGTYEPRALMPHYTVKEIAERWHLSDDTVRALFESEPGVLTIGGKLRPGKKRKTYASLRIPRDVVERVHARLSKDQVDFRHA